MEEMLEDRRGTTCRRRKIMVGAIAGVVLLVLLVVIGNVISIGDKIAGVHPVLAYLFYLLVALLLVWLVVLPVVRVVTAPPLNGLSAKRLEGCTPQQLEEHVKEIRKSVRLTNEEECELQNESERKNVLERIIARRYAMMEDVVRSSAVSSFAVTAISQNGSFDFISNIAINFKMINSVVRQLGRRPSLSQLLKLYLSVFSSSLIVTAVDEIVEEIDFSAILKNIGIAGKALGMVLPSAMNGLMNAFVTLKVGYATIKYIELGAAGCNKDEIRRFAVRSAGSKILSVGKDGVLVATKKLGNIFKKVIS